MKQKRASGFSMKMVNTCLNAEAWFLSIEKQNQTCLRQQQQSHLVRGVPGWTEHLVILLLSDFSFLSFNLNGQVSKHISSLQIWTTPVFPNSHHWLCQRAETCQHTVPFVSLLSPRVSPRLCPHFGQLLHLFQSTGCYDRETSEVL